MQALLNIIPGRVLRARLVRNVSTCRQIGTIAFALIACSSIAPSRAIGQEGLRVDRSPMVAKSTVLSALDPAKQISVVLSLPLRDSQGAANLVKHISDPKDPLYGQFISPEQFAARFGANEADDVALKDWASANGLQITQESVARTLLTVRGTVDQFQTLFKTQINNYRSRDGKEFYSASIEPTIPSAISSRVSGVIGLNGSAQYAPLAKVYKTFGENPVTSADRTDTAGGTGPGGAYAASDLRTAYTVPAFGGAVPQTVAVFEQGGFYRSDVDKYLDRMSLPHRPVTFVPVNGYDGSVDDPGVELEAVLDIDMVIGINPDVKEVLVYEDGTDNFNVALLDALDQVATDNKAQTLSISYGLDEVQEGQSAMEAENTALTQLAAQGITVLVSAGDQGAYGRTGTNYSPAQLNVSDPSSQPYVTSVGGTTLYTYANELYLGEEVWNDLGVGDGATGGGVSAYWSIPSYQFSYRPGINGGSITMRNVPDVAAVGDPLTGVAVYSKINGGWIQIGGTSVSAPIWAGYLSILNAGFEYTGVAPRLGFFNPTWWLLFVNSYISPLDIIDGSNGNANLFGTAGYNAGPGYDNCTGWGSLWGAGLAFTLLTTGNQLQTPPGFLNGLHGDVDTSSIRLVWKPTSGATGYVIDVILLNSGGGATLSQQTYIAKGETLEVKGLFPKTTYEALVAAVNPGGSSASGLVFTTK
jgi:subtilase family serine protease